MAEEHNSLTHTRVTPNLARLLGLEEGKRYPRMTIIGNFHRRAIKIGKPLIGNNGLLNIDSEARAALEISEDTPVTLSKLVALILSQCPDIPPIIDTRDRAGGDNEFGFGLN